MKERKNFLYYFVRNRNGMIGFIGVMIILLIGIFGPMLVAKPDGYTTDILMAPSAQHWLGTDNLGLDIFAELAWGARTSLYVSILAMLISGLIGIPLGLLCGYTKGIVSEVVDAFIDIFMTLPMLPLSPESYDIALKAISEGVRAHIDVIPSSVGHCTGKERMLLFTMALSDELFSQGIEGVKRALKTREGRELIKRENYTMAGPKDKIYIVHSEDPHLENRSVRDIARERGIDEDECMLDLMADDLNYVFWLNAPAANTPSKFIDHCDSIVANPYVSVGSDTIMGDPEDPFDWYEIRRRGGFAIFAQMYQKKGVPYEEIVRRNTTMVADHFGIYKRGRLMEGCYADVAVIDLPNYRYPEMDQIQYKTPKLNATGCDLVLCNGKVELKDGELFQTYAGRVLKKNEQGL